MENRVLFLKSCYKVQIKHNIKHVTNIYQVVTYFKKGFKFLDIITFVNEYFYILTGMAFRM